MYQDHWNWISKLYNYTHFDQNQIDKGLSLIKNK